MTSRALAEVEDNGYHWLHFIAKSCTSGMLWTHEYLHQYNNFEYLYSKALKRLRAGNIEAGQEALEEVKRKLSTTEIQTSMRHVLDRWHFGVLAYLHYRQANFDAADQALRTAENSVSQAIREHGFLVPLAYHCHEFGLHHARISRNRRDWKGMRRHLELVHGMIRGCVPLCIAGDSPISIIHITEFYRALPLDQREIDWLANLLDDNLRLRSFEQFTHKMLIQPHFAIRYP